MRQWNGIKTDHYKLRWNGNRPWKLLGDPFPLRSPVNLDWNFDLWVLDELVENLEDDEEDDGDDGENHSGPVDQTKVLKHGYPSLQG